MFTAGRKYFRPRMFMMHTITCIHVATGDCVVLYCELLPQLWLGQVMVDAIVQMLTANANEKIHIDKRVLCVLV